MEPLVGHKRPGRFAGRVAVGGATLALLLAPPATGTGSGPLCAGKPATIVGTDAAERLTGTGADDVIWAGPGNDQIEAGLGDDLVCAGPGDDTVYGRGGNDTLYGGQGADRLDGGSGNDALDGGSGPDRLLGGLGDDRLSGGLGNDVLQGGPGADLLAGGPGADRLQGDDGPDHLDGGSGPDAITGGGGNDRIWGGDGRDLLDGGDADDSLAGGNDDDRLRGGAGTDACDGGPGGDFAAECETVAATESGQLPRPLTRPGSHQVALTFDDGPAGTYTRQILDILAAYDAPGTFFVIGRQASEQPELLRRMVAEGHSVQNHTYSHAWLTRYSDASIRDQLARGSEVIRTATGVAPNCMRPPFGAVSDRVRDIAADLGLATIMWDVDPWDWKRPGAAAVASRVLHSTQGGDIVLFHDTAGPSTIGALPTIIQTLRDRGLELVPLCTVPGIAPRSAERDGSPKALIPG